MAPKSSIHTLLHMLRTALDALCVELGHEVEPPPPASLQHVPPPPAALPAQAPLPLVTQPAPPGTAGLASPVGVTAPSPFAAAPPPVGPPPLPPAQPVPPPPADVRPPWRRRTLPAPPVGAEQTGLGLSRLPRTLQQAISRHATSVLRAHRSFESPLHLDADSSAAFLDVAAFVLSCEDVARANPTLSEVDVWLVLRTSNKRGVARFHFSVAAGERADYAARAAARVRAARRPAPPTPGQEYVVSDDDSDTYPPPAGPQPDWSAASSATAERNVRPRRA